MKKETGNFEFLWICIILAIFINPLLLLFFVPLMICCKIHEHKQEKLRIYNNLNKHDQLNEDIVTFGETEERERIDSMITINKNKLNK